MTRTDPAWHERQRMAADAIVLERAIRVLVRRYGDTEPVPFMRAYLFNMSLALRSQSLEGLSREEASLRA